MKKGIIRKKILKIREKLSRKIVEKNSEKILKQLFQIEEFRQAKKVMFYSSFGNEVSTENMIKKSLKLKKDVFLPKILRGKILPVQIKSLKDLIRSKFGIPEPKTMNHELRTVNYLDVIIVPGVAYDKNCNRIGFGKGYFDRFLKTQKAINPALPKGHCRKIGVKIGLAHSFQIVKKIPMEKFDVPTDLVITEKNIFISSELQKRHRISQKKHRK